MDVKQNVMDTVKGKMNKLFAVVLSDMESGSQLKDVRKTLLDEGNGIVNFLELVFTKIEVTPVDAIIYIKEEDVQSEN